jgi:hypothetical protein
MILELAEIFGSGNEIADIEVCTSCTCVERKNRRDTFRPLGKMNCIRVPAASPEKKFDRSALATDKAFTQITQLTLCRFRSLSVGGSCKCIIVASISTRTIEIIITIITIITIIINILINIIAIMILIAYRTTLCMRY